MVKKLDGWFIQLNEKNQENQENQEKIIVEVSDITMLQNQEKIIVIEV